MREPTRGKEWRIARLELDAFVEQRARRLGPRHSDWSGSTEGLVRFENELHRAFDEMRVIALCPCLLDAPDRTSFDALMELVPHHSGTLHRSGTTPVLMKASA